MNRVKFNFGHLGSMLYAEQASHLRFGTKWTFGAAYLSAFENTLMNKIRNNR